MPLPDGKVTHWFGGEERTFLIRLGQLREIQRRCDAGPATIAHHLARAVAVRQARPDAGFLDLALAGLGDWRIDYVRSPILEGLVAGGMSANDAGQLVKTHIDDRGFRGLLENVDLALTLIVAGVDTGEAKDEEDGDDAGETTAPATAPKKKTTTASTSRRSTPPAAT